MTDAALTAAAEVFNVQAGALFVKDTTLNAATAAVIRAYLDALEDVPAAAEYVIAAIRPGDTP